MAHALYAALYSTLSYDTTMKNTPVSVVVVTYHGDDVIPQLLASLQEQTFLPAEIIIIDNSTEPTNIEKIAQSFSNVHVFRQQHNVDFAKGYNIGIAKAHSPLILLLNQDIVCTPRAVEQLVDAMDTNPRLGAVAPRLLRSATPPHIIDSMGIQKNIFWRCTNIGEGETDDGQYDHTREPIALSGAAMLVRKNAIDDVIAHGGGGGMTNEFFDEQFIAYKEDIDVSLRLRHRGWHLRVVPEAVMIHARTAQKAATVTKSVLTRRRRSYRMNAYSLRNQWWLLLKNLPLVEFLIRAPLVIPYELAKIFVILGTHPTTLGVLPSFFRGLPTIQKKRKAILQSRMRERTV